MVFLSILITVMLSFNSGIVQDPKHGYSQHKLIKYQCNIKSTIDSTTKIVNCFIGIGIGTVLFHS